MGADSKVHVVEGELVKKPLTEAELQSIMNVHAWIVSVAAVQEAAAMLGRTDFWDMVDRLGHASAAERAKGVHFRTTFLKVMNAACVNAKTCASLFRLWPAPSTLEQFQRASPYMIFFPSFWAQQHGLVAWG